jgi:hypothetical protein
MMILEVFICIIGALFGGMMLNEIRHVRCRTRQTTRLISKARRTRAIITWAGQ